MRVKAAPAVSRIEFRIQFMAEPTQIARTIVGLRPAINAFAVTFELNACNSADLTCIFHTRRSRRREEADFAERPNTPPPHVGGYNLPGFNRSVKYPG